MFTFLCYMCIKLKIQIMGLVAAPILCRGILLVKEMVCSTFGTFDQSGRTTKSLLRS